MRRPILSKPQSSSLRPLLLTWTFVLGALVLLNVTADEAEATHYRYGSLSWEPTGSPNEVRFTGAQAWRASAFGDPAVGAIIQGESVIQPGDGTNLPFYLVVTSKNPVNDWFFAQIVDANGDDGVVHTYPAENNNGAPFLASWASCCRISPHSSGNFHVNNPDQSERLETLVDLASTNSSPKTNLPPINPCPLDAVCSIPIPFVDPDDDTLSFRLANAAEAGDGNYVPPGPPHATHPATIDSATGTITWNTTGATYSATEHTLYSMQVMLEDGQSKTPLDFFVELIPEDADPPYWTSGSACGTTVPTYVGATASFTVTAQSDDPSRLVTLGHLGLPPGATFTHTSPDNPVTGTFTWSPTAQDVGTHLVIFTAYDDKGYAAPSCPVTLQVTFEDPPVFIDPSPCGFTERLIGPDGVPITFAVAAHSENLSQTLTLSLDSGPAGLVFTPGTPGNPVSGTANWAAPVSGLHTAVFRATDLDGVSTVCRVYLDIVPPGGQALALGVWGGSAVPFSIEYTSNGVDHRTTGASTTPQVQRAAVVHAPSLGVRAEGVEEAGSVTIRPGETVAHGRVEIAQLDLAGGLVSARGLVLDATLHWDWQNNTTTVTREASIAELFVAGEAVPVSAGPYQVDLPGGGRLVLFERYDHDEGSRAAYGENLVHAYLPASYGRAELIVGSVLLQGGIEVPFQTQARAILEDDDGDSGRDAGAGAPVPLAPGVTEGALSDGDGEDHYVIGLQHGEKIQLVLQPAAHLTASGGGLFADDSPNALWTPPGTRLAPFERMTIALYDPDGNVRDTSEVGIAGGPERVELNADLDGDWTVQVGRLGLTDARLNYTLAAAVTPVALLDQNDALSGGDAPGACNVGDPAIPTIGDGVWPGVLRDDDHVDVYRFHANLGDLVTALLKPGETADGVDMALSLYDRTCTLLTHSDLDPAGLKGLPEAALRLPSHYTGDYYVAVERHNGVGNHYLTLRVQDPMPGLPNNDAGSGSDAPTSRSAASEAPPVAFTGTFHEGDAGDAYLLRFAAGQGEAFVAIDIGAGSSFYPTLYDPNGAIVPPHTHLASLAVYRFDPALSGLYGLELRPNAGGGDYWVAYGQAPVSP